MAPPQGKTLSQAEIDLKKICRDEFQYTVTTKLLDHTLWVYLPMKDRIVDTKAAEANPAQSPTAKKNSLSYVDSEFSDKTFNIEFEISPTSRQRDYGYTSTYTEEYQKVQHNLFTAIARAYFDVGTVPGDVTNPDPQKQASHQALVKAYVKTDKLPDFFVVVIADTVKGLETQTLFYIQDLKEYMTGSLPGDEYPKRFINELHGSQAGIGDMDGKHLDYQDYTWPEFLSRQITARINFKYHASSFPPSSDAMNEMEKIVGETLRAYQFTDFDSLQFKDLKTDSTTTIGRGQLEELYNK